MWSPGVEDFKGTARFTIVRRLGAGGMGVVYEAHDRERDARVALKTLPRLDPGSLYHFKQEFRALTDVVHPNLVALYELIAVGDQWFFTMELVRGSNFLDHVRHGPHASWPELPSVLSSAAAIRGTDAYAGDMPHGSHHRLPATEPFIPMTAGTGATAVGPPTHGPPLSAPEQWGRLRAALVQLAEGVEALHKAGKLHRDIKPSNVLVTAEGRVVLLDFGLVAEWQAQPLDPVSEHEFAGTAAYMAPEQAAGEPLTPASDWYAVGVMLYEALTGRLPFLGPTGAVLLDKQAREPVPPADLVPDLPEDLETLCRQLLRRRPADRPPGREVLQRLRGGGPAAGSAAPERAPVPRAPFVGRERHLAALADAYQATRHGRTVTVYVHGRSGVGKSLLLQRFLEGLVEREDVVVLAGRCYEQESVPYKALDSLVDALSRCLRRLPSGEADVLMPRHVAALARLFPVLRRVEAVSAAADMEMCRVALTQLFPAEAPRPAGEIPDVQELRRRAFGALRELLIRLSDRKPLILCIDDLQWGDADSAALLADLLRPPDPPALLLLAAYRSEYAATSACLRALLEARDPADARSDRRELAVEPLTADDARTLAQELLGETGDSTAVKRAEAIARESGGSPYFVQELVQYVRSGAELAGPSAAAAGITLDEVLWRRAAALPEAARRLLEVVTVSGRPLRQGDAYRAAGLIAADRTPLAQLRVGRLVRSTGPGEQDEVETYHDRIRETVRAHLPPGTLKGYHAQLAATLEATGRADPETLAVHFQGAGEPAKAGHYYAVAADEAAEALAFDRAAKLYRLSLELRPLDGERGRELRTRLADALANAGRGPEAARQYLAAAEGTTGRERIELERRAAYQFCSSGHLDEGRTVLHAVLGRVGMKLPGSQWRALASLLFNRLCLRLRGLKFRERRSERVSDRELARIDVSWSVAAGLGTKNIIVAPAFQTRNLLLALRAGEPFRVARALAWEAAQVANEGGPAQPRARVLLDAARELAGRINQPYVNGLVAMVEGILDFHGGRWKSAVANQERALQIFREQCTGVAWERGQANAFLLWCISWAGAFAEMTRRSAEILQEAREKGDLFTAANLGTYIEPLARLCEDDPAAAGRVIEEAVRGWSREEYNLQHFTALMGSTYVDLYRGEPEAAYQRTLQQWPALTKGLLLHAQICRVSIYELRARSALGVAARTADRGPLLRDAEHWVRKLERERMPYATALAGPLRAGLAALRGDRTEAARLLGEAARALDAVDMGLFAAVARRRLGELLGGGEGQALLDAANTWMAGQKIQNPTRMTAAFAPWLADG